jgi:hypothetical protein
MILFRKAVLRYGNGHSDLSEDPAGFSTIYFGTGNAREGFWKGLLGNATPGASEP